MKEGYCQGKVAGGCAIEPYNSSEWGMTDVKGMFPRKRRKKLCDDNVMA